MVSVCPAQDFGSDEGVLQGGALVGTNEHVSLFGVAGAAALRYYWQ